MFFFVSNTYKKNISWQWWRYGHCEEKIQTKSEIVEIYDDTYYAICSTFFIIFLLYRQYELSAEFMSD